MPGNAQDLETLVRREQLAANKHKEKFGDYSETLNPFDEFRTMLNWDVNFVTERSGVFDKQVLDAERTLLAEPHPKLLAVYLGELPYLDITKVLLQYNQNRVYRRKQAGYVLKQGWPEAALARVVELQGTLKVHPLKLWMYASGFDKVSSVIESLCLPPSGTVRWTTQPKRVHSVPTAFTESLRDAGYSPSARVAFSALYQNYRGSFSSTGGLADALKAALSG